MFQKSINTDIMNERRLFLDFDGVLNHVSWMEQWGKDQHSYGSLLERHYKQLDPVRVKMISDFAVEMNVGIIISSTWRILHPLHELCDMLLANGMDENVLPRGVTPQQGNFRGDQIIMWLDQNPHITNHVIFDDDGDFHPDQPLVQTSWEEGLLPIHIDKARKILLNIDNY